MTIVTVAAFLGDAFNSLAVAADAASHESPDSALIAGTTEDLQELECRPASTTDPGWQLCDHPQGPIDWSIVDSLEEGLRSGMQDRQTLCAIDVAVVRAQKACSSGQKASRSLALRGVLAMLASQWRLQGNLQRADQIYGYLYESSRRVPTLVRAELWTGMYLENWARLKLDRGDHQAAKRLAARQVEFAREAYASNPRLLGLLALALKSRAITLIELGAIGEARAVLQELEELPVLQESVHRIWLVSYIFPKLQPALAAVKRAVDAEVPASKSDIGEVKLRDDRVAIHAGFSIRPPAENSSVTIRARFSCGVALNFAPDSDIEEPDGARVCRSYITEVVGGVEHALQIGPVIEVDLDGDNHARIRVDEWVRATTTFFLENTNLIVAELR